MALIRLDPFRSSLIKISDGAGEQDLYSGECPVSSFAQMRKQRGTIRSHAATPRDVDITQLVSPLDNLIDEGHQLMNNLVIEQRCLSTLLFSCSI